MFETTAQYPAFVITTAQIAGMIALICVSYVSYKAAYTSRYAKTPVDTSGKAYARFLLLPLGAISAYLALSIALVMADYSQLIFPLVFLLMPPFGLPYLVKQWFTRNSNTHTADSQDQETTEK
jgi:hypothetical protein